MKNIKSIVALFALVIVTSTISGQEIIYPLNVNQALIDHANQHSSLMRNSSVDDTVSLPFEDDFSRPGIYPFDSLWLDSSGVYINNNYSEKPFTIGIATFDGLNQNGRPYQPNSNKDSVADILTSRPIDLTVPLGDTTVWFYFFYQAEGLGDIPEAGDSLVLQFRDSSGSWNHIWAVDGKADSAFQRVNIHIIDNIYFYRGFQFRFYNIATVNGNRDQWNLDYLSLRTNTYFNATITDNALVRPQISLLSEYTAMPYPHYKAIGLGAMKSEVDDTIFNIDYGQTSYTPAIEILDDSGLQIFSGTTFTSTTVSNVYLPFTIPLNSFSFPVQNTDRADFHFKSYFSQPGIESNSFNDTSYLDQHFYNYYSYDDGSAEVSYGLTGNSDVAIAYQFDVKITDTLRGVQIYFNPTGEDVSNKLFQLTVWSDVNIGTNQDVELYRMIDQKPDTTIGLNGFRTYLFDVPLVVGPGNIWVGIIQNDPEVLYGIGLDRNTDSRSKMFYHLDGSWYQSAIRGTWMMRPLFGKRIDLVSVDEVAKKENLFHMLPNPAGDKLRIELVDKNHDNLFQVYNVTGAIVMEEKINSSGVIDISMLPKGVYIVKLINEKNKLSDVQKLVVQ